MKMGYTCHLCPYSTTRKSNLERHLKTHDNMMKTDTDMGNKGGFKALGENTENALIKIDLRLIPNFKLFICGPSR